MTTLRPGSFPAKSCAAARAQLSRFLAVSEKQNHIVARSWPFLEHAGDLQQGADSQAVIGGAGAGDHRVGVRDEKHLARGGPSGDGRSFSSAFAGMFETFNRRCHQHLYDTVLSRPVEVWELVTAEASWIAVKSSVYSSVPLLVTLAIGLPLTPALLLVPVVTLVSGLAFALCGMWISTQVPAIDWLRLVVSGVLTPLVMAAGVFFPLGGLPGWINVVAILNPIYHCMQLVRHAAFGVLGSGDWLHALVLAGFTAATWFLAVRGMSRRLFD